MYRFYDFFAGAGLTTLALSDSWKCLWANDNDERKARVYRDNFPSDHFVCRDIAKVAVEELPDGAHMAWASFPCQDLSLAGWRRGLSAERSGTFWRFWRLMREQHKAGKRPPIIVIENVVGLLYGDNFRGLSEALARLEMQFGALVIDAKHFIRQSRPRVFVVAVDARLNVARYTTRTPNSQWVPPSLANAAASLRPKHQDLWRWWDLPAPEEKWLPLSKILEAKPTCVEWHSAEETRYISSLMNETSSANLEAARRSTGRLVGFMYKRMREGKQRAEVRFDGLSGCLRTPKGGSSRQTVIIVESGVVKSRLLSPREAARLMGVPDSFVLPPKYNDAYKAMADGVAIPVVQWLSSHLLEPLVRLSSSGRNKMVTRRPLRQITTARPAASSRVSKLPNGKVAPTPAPSG